MIPEVLILMKLILASPTTNTISERRFFRIKRSQTAFGSTISDLKLSNLMSLQIIKDLLTNTVHVTNNLIIQ